MEKEFCLEKDEEVVLEEEDELNDLIYTGESDKPVFELVKVTKKDFSIYELFRKYQKGQLTLEVDFQRKSVWDNKQKCELIESILMGLPLPIFYLKQQNNSTYVVVDGKQRLSTLFDFLQNKFQLKLLKILTFLNGKKIYEFRRRIWNIPSSIGGLSSLFSCNTSTDPR